MPGFGNFLQSLAPQSGFGLQSLFPMGSQDSQSVGLPEMFPAFPSTPGIAGPTGFGDDLPVNVMQQVAPGQTASPRRSLLDTVGRISDVIAQVGGATPLFQPTLDAREDRDLAKQAALQKFDLDRLKVALLAQKQASEGRTPLQNDLIAAGFTPGTSEFQNVLQKLTEARFNQPKFFNIPGVGFVQDPEFRPIFGDDPNVPSGSPLEPPSQTVDGKQFWFVNGQWYDNPEGK